MSDDELIAQYNSTSRSTQLGLSFLREELWRREMDRAQQKVNDATMTTKRLTWAILGLTVVNVVVVSVQVASS